VPTYDDSLDPARVTVELFGESGVNGVEKLFAQGGEPFAERVRLACVLLSAGDPAKLRHFIAQARADTRDVLYWAFYYDDAAPANMRRYLARR
jgi:hypothetical protein